MDFEKLPERITNFANRMMGVKKRPDPRTSETPIFGTFQDRLFASVIDIGVIVILFSDLFHWIASLIYRDIDPTAFAQLPPEAVNTTPDQQAEILAQQVIDSGFIELWLLNSFVQSLVVGFLLIAVWSQFHTTPGKYIVGLRFAKQHGEGVPTFKDYLVRYAGFYLSMPVLMIGFVLLGFDEEKRAWHDRIAGTTVIYTREGSIFRRLWDWLKAKVKSD